MVVNTPSRTVLLFKDAMEFFFQLRASSKPGTFEQVLNSIQYPPHFTETYAEEEGKLRIQLLIYVESHKLDDVLSALHCQFDILVYDLIL